MIMFWNRKEVYMGYSLNKFNEVREILTANKIKYAHKLVNNNKSFSSTRARMGSFGEKQEYSITYYVYVHKEDYDKACIALKK